MKVVHWGMIYTDGHQSVYGTHVSICLWRNRDRGQWSGRILYDTCARLTLDKCQWDVAADRERRTELDELARREAARLGLPAGPDVFPFSN
mgnify:CR=1 FL=1